MNKTTTLAADSPVDYQQSMRERKAEMREKVAKAKQIKGVWVALTGDGKGKSSSAFGMVARALGHDMRVGVLQFIKGAWPTGEEAFFSRQPGVSWKTLGKGFTWDTQNFEQDCALAHQGLMDHQAWFAEDSPFDMIVLDELHVALAYGFLQWDAIAPLLINRPAHQHLITTGRTLPEGIATHADTLSEILLGKHAFDQGIQAQKGIEF